MMNQLWKKLPAGLLPLLYSFALAQSAPRVDKVDPPEWWLGLPAPMLLIQGQDLTEAKVTLARPYPGVIIDHTADGQDGRYLFVWLKFGKLAKPGDVALSVATKGGRTTLKLPLRRRNPSALKPAPNGGFDGITPEDALYQFASSGKDSLAGIRDRLPGLKGMGFTGVVLPPLYADEVLAAPSDFYGLDAKAGDMQALHALAVEAHALGMKLVLTLEADHISAAHPWATDAPGAYWIYGSRDKHLAVHSPVSALADPHAAQRESRDITEGWMNDAAPGLNTNDPDLQQYLAQNALWWTETSGADAVLLDSFPNVDRPFWHDFNTTLHKVYPRIRTIGVVDSPDPAVTSFFAGGRTMRGIETGVDTLLDTPLAAVLDSVASGGAISQLHDVLRLDSLYPKSDDLVTSLGDGSPKRDMSGTARDKYRLALGLLMTLRGTPLIRQGEEAGFAEDLNALLKVRSEHSAFRFGRLTHAFAGDKVYAFVREDLGAISGFTKRKHEVVLVVANSGDDPQTVSIPTPDTPIETAEMVENILAAQPATLVKGKSIAVTIGPRSLAVYLVKCGCDLD